MAKERLFLKIKSLHGREWKAEGTLDDLDESFQLFKRKRK